MRGEDRTSGGLFSYVDVEARIGANHPLRAMRLTNAALAELDPRFSALYEGIGRPSIAPERLLRASLRVKRQSSHNLFEIALAEVSMKRRNEARNPFWIAIWDVEHCRRPSVREPGGSAETCLRRFAAGRRRILIESDDLGR